MNPKVFLEEFGAIANAPGGIQRFREMILQLAMMGKLVEQDPNDADSEVLLQQVFSDKEVLVKNKIIGKQKKISELIRSEIPYSIPLSWKWVRFGEICHHNSGKTLDKKRNTGELRKYITTSNLYWGQFELDEIREMPIKKEELAKCQAQKDDLLICEGGEAGRSAVWTSDEKICFQNHIHRARFYAGIDPHFYFRFFQKLDLSGEINKGGG